MIYRESGSGSDTSAESTTPEVTESNPLHVPTSDVSTYNAVPSTEPDGVSSTSRVIIGTPTYHAADDSDEPSH